MGCAATDSDEVLKVATPPAIVLVTSGVAPSLNVTLPVGEPAPSVTVAVKVTDWPKTVLFEEVERAVVVEPLVTVTLALVFAVSEPPEEWVAVTVGVPAVPNAKLAKVPVPEDKVRFPGVQRLTT